PRWLASAAAAGSPPGPPAARQYSNEPAAPLARSLPAAVAAGLDPILCIGETESQRDEDATEAVLRRQLEADLANVAADELARLVVAYEPVWAIGTGRNATLEQAAEAIAFIRSVVGEASGAAAEGIRIGSGRSGQ